MCYILATKDTIVTIMMTNTFFECNPTWKNKHVKAIRKHLTLFPFYTTPNNNIDVQLGGAQMTSISRSTKSFHSKNISYNLCLVLQDTKREADNHQEDNLTKTP
jgi:hypothetical protein